MKIKLLGHTILSASFFEECYAAGVPSSGQAIALSAIRTCYSHLEPSKIVPTEGSKYFGKKATDGKEGTEADRLIRHIVNSGHTSTLEHLSFTFALEGVSRSLLAQLTRHRHLSFSVQSQRYVKFGSGDKSNGFGYVMPESCRPYDNPNATIIFQRIMEQIQVAYDELRKLGVPAEDARYLLPNAAECNLVLTGNLRALLDFCSKRGGSTHAQAEIKELAENLKKAVIQQEPWTERFFQ